MKMKFPSEVVFFFFFCFLVGTSIVAQLEVLSIRSVMSYVSSECTVAAVRMHMITLIRFRISDNDVQNSNFITKNGANRRDQPAPVHL